MSQFIKSIENINIYKFTYCRVLNVLKDLNRYRLIYFVNSYIGWISQSTRAWVSRDTIRVITVATRTRESKNTDNFLH